MTTAPSSTRITQSPRLSLRLSALFAALTLAASAWTPGTGTPDAVGNTTTPLTVDSADRNDVVSFYQCIFKASDDFATNLSWTGNVSTCDPGTTGAAFKDDVQRRVNWYRAMSDIDADIEFTTAFNADSQAAALIMAEHGSLSHTPGADFGMAGCWTASGENGANKGNLALGNYGPDAIDAYIEDAGGNNLAVGHRRWILYPRATLMGTGDIPSSGSYPYTGPGEHWDTNCLFVIDSGSFRSGIGEFVAWPPEGYVPSATTWPRWSLHYSRSTGSNPSFGSATVTMTRTSDSMNIPVSIVHTYTSGGAAGDPAIVWEPDWTAFGGTPPLEDEIEITVAGITPNSSGAPTSHTYHVTIIDAETITDPVVPSGTTTPPPAGAVYSFTPVTGVGAESYDLGVSVKTPSTWTEGAEDSPTPQVIDNTSAGYDLRTNLTPAGPSPGNHTGSKVFHLTIPSFAEVEQSFEIDRTIIPTATSRLQFQQLFRWATTVSTLSAQVSDNDGSSWTTIYTQTGNGSGSSGDWPSSWTFEDEDLSAYDGVPICIRFHYTAAGSAFLGTSNNYGCFVDQVTVTNGLELGPETITNLSGAATSFTLDATTAGGPLANGDQLVLRLRPTVGCKTFGFDTPLEVTVTSPPTFADWMATNHPTVTPNGPNDDPDNDGLDSVAEFALGTNPGIANLEVPGKTIGSGTVTLSIDTSTLGYPPTGITYGAESSTDMVTWTPIPNTGSGDVHTFVLPTGPDENFIRWAITHTP